MMDLAAKFSVVIPFFNEGANVTFVLNELRAVLPTVEIIAVDDGSVDDTWERIGRTQDVRGLRFHRNQGQSAAIYHGLKAASREYCGLMDGDGQTDPMGFHPLLEEMVRGTADVACGYRAERRDPWNRRVAARVANGIRRTLLGDGVRDAGCSQKIFPRTAVEVLVPFRGLHRYLPAFFQRAGLRIVEVPVNHRERRAGASKYDNRSRAVAGVRDLIGVAWLLKRAIRINPSEIESTHGPCHR
jgi:dolichol-phosphate mannosyltransferase